LKIAVPLVAISVTAATWLGTTMIAATRESFARTYAAQAEGLAQLVASGYASNPDDQVALNAFLTDIWSSVPSVRRIRLFRDYGGTPVLWASTDTSELKRYQPRPEEVAPITAGVGTQTETTSNGQRMLETIEPVRVGGRRIVASVGVFTALRERDQAVMDLERKILAVAALGVAAELLALWMVFFWLVLRRMVRLSQAATQVAEGDLNVRLPEGQYTGGGDELFQVAREFDHMLATVRSRTQQQAAVTRLGQRALEGADLAALLEEAVEGIAENLEVEQVSVLKHRPDAGSLLLLAGRGWNEGETSYEVPASPSGSLAGYALASGKPVTVGDYRGETRFTVSTPLRDHHMLSAMSVIIPGQDQPYGVLAVNSKRLRMFGGNDVQFLQAMANTLGWTVRHKYAQEQLREARVLEMIAKNEPIANILNTLTEMVESQRPGAVCSVLLARDRSLFHAAGRRLPDGYIQAIDGSPIGPDGGLAAASAHQGESVIVADVDADPSWRVKDATALAHGLRAAWAVPIAARDGTALGTFVTWYREPRTPTTDDLRLIGTASYLATIAIEQRSFTEKLTHQAHHDALTGLPNRLLFEDRLQQALAQAKRNGNVVGLLFADLNNFKRINDTLGHRIGDVLLQYVAQRLGSRIRQSDTLARMGGDEFAVVLTGLKDPREAATIAQKLLDALHSAFDVEGYQLFLGGAIGISLYPQDGQDAAVLQRNADTAMYRAKVQGEDSFRFFAPEMHAEALERLELDSSLRRALDNQEFRLHYQPQFDMQTGKLVGAEALLRWYHPTAGPIPPARFIPLAEENGLIVPIGTWVLREACQQNAAWQRMGYQRIRVSVNVSALQFARPDFVQTVSQALDECGLEPHWLDLELTESLLMRDIDSVRLRLAELRALGVGISIDDFGTGYSSLAYLQQLPIESLKIDQSFVRDIGTGPGASAPAPTLVKTILSLAHNLGMKVVAEGVETPEQLEFLRAAACDRGQGYLLARPMPAEQMLSVLERMARGKDQAA
jgi:diguanylate cyclase (GGDEF)-like protein